MSAIKLISSKKSPKFTLPVVSSKVAVILLNSIKLSSLSSLSSDGSFSSSSRIPDLSKMSSINSVRDMDSLSFCSSKIKFLNSNSLPFSMASNILIFFSFAIVSIFAMVLAPIFLFGTLITLLKDISS